MQIVKSVSAYARALGIWGWATTILDGLSAYQLYASWQARVANYDATGVAGLLPLWAWAVIVVALLVIAPFMAFNKIRVRLTSFEDAQPDIVFDSIKESPLYTHLSSGEVKPNYHILQVWFKNRPPNPQPSTEAKEVTATISFFSHARENTLFQLPG